jgi:hypothetical protein
MNIFKKPIADRRSKNLRIDALIFVVSAIYFAAQMATGTDVYAASLFSAAIFFGLYSVRAAGGLTSAPGILNASIITKFLLIAIVLKVISGQAADSNLYSPLSTPAVMALGFLGLLIGTSIQSKLPSPKRPLVQRPEGSDIYLALTVAFLVLGYGCYMVAMGPELAGEGVQTGGIMGLARNISSYKSFAIVSALFWAWSKNGKRILTHPLVLSVLVFGVVVGVFTTGKQDAIEPLAFYMLVGVLRYGLRDKRLWAVAGVSLVYYAAIIYPYSQYVRHNGGRAGTLSERVDKVQEIFWLMLTDPSYRENAEANTITGDARSYLGEEALQPFGRLAMVGEADRLIAATEDKQAFTGWETITWGLKLMAPSFIYPDKPIVGAGNFLGHIPGDLGDDDLTTQISFGFMANLYNAFSFQGVLIGSILLAAILYYTLRLWFGDPRWVASSQSNTLWFLLIVASLHHPMAEESVAGLFPAMVNFPLAALIFYWSARVLTMAFGKKGGRRGNVAVLAAPRPLTTWEPAPRRRTNYPLGGRFRNVNP